MEYKNYKQIGEIGERISIGELAKYGIDILLPMSDNLPFDYVAYHNNKLYKCQIKSTSGVNEYGSLEFSLTSNNWNKGTKTQYTSTDCDVIILCDLNTIYLFKQSELEGKQSICLKFPNSGRITKSTNLTIDYIISQDRINKVFD